MAGLLTNTLYAPLVSTFMRAFPNNTDAVVYFSYSPLNDSSQVAKVHVSVVNQENNENALEDATGILIYETENTVGTIHNAVGFDTKSGLYYIIIPHSALKGSTDWNINQFYKVQLRLDSTKEGSYVDVKAKMNYLTENQNNFSEWSTVCLLRPILQPYIALKPWDAQSGDEPYVAKLNKGIVNLSGRVIFGEMGSLETETLQSYVLELLPQGSDQVVWSSGNVYTGDLLDPNVINYQLTLQGINTNDTSLFTLRVTITTENLYVTSKDFDLSINDYVEMTDFHPIGYHENDPMNTDLTVSINQEEGIASFRFRNLVAVYGKIYVKRSSSISQFKDWETIYEANVSDVIDVSIVDNTISSFVWYRYSIQFENSVGAFSNVYYTGQFMAKFYDAFISRLDKQLDLRYDFKISSVKPVVNRTKIDTLGGRYPKFAENAILNYKQFSVTGVISAEADYNQLFLNKQQYYGEEYQNYRVYLSDEGIKSIVRNDAQNYDQTNDYLTTTQDDWFWEREFREAVVAWLNDGEPKLFRSASEGSVPVMVTDISLTPKAQLGRRLYDFSATMYEVGKGESLADLEALGIYHVPRIAEAIGDGNPGIGGDVLPDDHRTVEMISQVYAYSPTNNNNIITSGGIQETIINRYKMGGVYSEREAYDLYIKNVKIFFHNKPHLFLIGTNNNIQLVENPTSAQVQTNRLRLGYTFQLQTDNSSAWRTIFVNERGYYQLPDDLNITGLAFNQYTDAGSGTIGDTVTIEYIAVFNERSSSGSLVTGSNVERTVLGQYEGIYTPMEYLGDRIRSKYSYITSQYQQRMRSWKGICLDVTPYAVVAIRYTNSSQYNEYRVGATGVLHMLQDFAVENLYFLGRFMVERPIERQEFVDPWEYVRSEESANATADIRKPINNTVYSIGGSDMIYYQDNWYSFDDKGDGTGIAAVNIEGQINFIGDVVRNEY